jgi:plasmid stabilization system protein ParE
VSYTILFTPEAEDTYDSVVAQLLHRWGVAFAEKFEAKVSKALDSISSSPYLYPIVVESTEIRKYILHKNCPLLYKIIDKP